MKVRSLVRSFNNTLTLIIFFSNTNINNVNKNILFNNSNCKYDFVLLYLKIKTKQKRIFKNFMDIKFNSVQKKT